MAIKSNISFTKTLLLTGLALIAFAANSVLCRLALGEEVIDASSFTVVRLLSGIIVLLLILKISSSNQKSTSYGSCSAVSSGNCRDWRRGIYIRSHHIASFYFGLYDTGRRNHSTHKAMIL